MTAFSLDPLIAEAKRKASRRRARLVLVAGLLAAGVAAGAYLMRVPNPAGPPKPPASSSGTGVSGPLRQYDSSLGWSLRFPRGIHVEHAAASGISFAVDEATFSSFRSRHGVQRRVTRDGETIREVAPRGEGGRFPADGIAVRVLWLQTLGPIPSGATHFPLRLSSFRVGGPLRNWYPGTHPRPLQHIVLLKGQRYFVQVWIGAKVSAHRRALLARVIATISVRRPRPAA